ncbi:MAG: selenium-dependent molybdenum cofactor biosynthesis protein YqeB [Syntrophorhabdales bacterium]|jgi:xanthine dehydrogenase accessory factor
MRELVIAILGAGEMATGIAHRLHTSHFTHILMSEIPAPLAVRRAVSFSEAVYSGEIVVEGVRAERAGDLPALPALWDRSAIAVLIDEDGAFLKTIKPDVLIDATMMKKPKESPRDRAPFSRLVIGVGPGFRAPDHVDVVIESNRGHDLGRAIYDGEAEPYTGIPGAIRGVTKKRVLRAPNAGLVRPVRAIGDMVKKGDVILQVGESPVRAEIDGVLRGLITPIEVSNNEKVGDVDPSGDRRHCFTISEKARAIAGGVLEAIMRRFG